MVEVELPQPPDEAPPPPVRPRYRRRKLAAKLFLGLAGLVLLALAILNSPIGHRFVADRLARLAPASGLRVEIGRIDGSLFGRALLRDVTLSDPKGPFLTVPEAELDWRPFNWFFSGLDVRQLVARRGTLLRLPELEPPDPDAPLLPDFDIRIDRFELVDFMIAQSVLGERRSAQLLARANLRDDHAYLRLRGRFGGGDRVEALLDSRPSRNRFRLLLDYRAPAGGLLAALTGSDKALRARIAGKGTWSDWAGGLLIEREKDRLAALRLTNREGRYGLLGKVRPELVTSGIPARLLVGDMSLGAYGTLDNSEVDGAARLRGRALDLAADGGIDLAGKRVKNLALKARLLDPVLLGEGTRIEGARLSARLDGRFRELSVAHDLRIDRLEAGIDVTGLDQKGTVRLADTRWTIPLDATVERVETGLPALDRRLVKGRLSGNITLGEGKIASSDLRLAFPQLAARLALAGTPQAGRYLLTGPVEARNLALENLGAINAMAKVEFTLAPATPWQLRADVRGTMPRVTNATLESIAGRDIRFAGAVRLGGGQPVLINGASLAASKLELALDGRVADGQTILAGRGRHASYGPFSMDAEIAGDGPRARLVFANPLPAAGLRDVHVALAPIPGGFRIDTRGDSYLGLFDGTIDLFSRPGGPTRLEVRQLSLSEMQLSGGLALADAGASGTLAVSGGGMGGQLTLAPRAGGQGLEIELAGKDARFRGKTPLSIRKLQLSGSAVLGGERTQAQGSVFAQGLSRGRLFIGRLAGRADVTDGRGSMTASMAGRRGSRFNLQLQAGFAPERIAVGLRGDFAEKRIAMPRQAIFTRAQGGWRLAPAQINFGKGTVIAEGHLGGDHPSSWKLHMDSMPLSMIDLIYTDIGLGGTASGVIDFQDGSGEPPAADIRLRLDGLSRSGLVLTSRPVDLYLVSRLSADALEGRAVIRERGVSRGRMQLRIVAMPRLGELVERMNAGVLNAQISYSGPADSLWRLAAVEAFDLTGPVDLTGNFYGSLLRPVTSGSVSSDSLRMRSGLTGTDIRDIALRGRFSGSQLRLTKIAGTARNGGSVSGSGTVNFEGLGEHAPAFDLRIAASNALILDRKDMAAKVSGPLRIVSDGNGGTIAGRLKLAEASWRLGSASPAKALPDIATREINLPVDIAPVQSRRGPWRYLIDAKGSSRVFVRGMGMDSEWGADLLIRGTTADPRVGGQVRLVRGAYEFAGTRFDLTRGGISFDENAPPDPRLDLLAETDLSDLSVRVTVKGTASQPDIAFNSTPALPEEELLARLLFGGSIADISATDALQLGSALASLRGGGGLDPINRLRSAIGLDRLRIISADPSQGVGTAVAAGKNFSRRIYAEIITDGRGYSATRLEFKVTSWLSLLGAVSTLGRESVVAEISRDY